MKRLAVFVALSIVIVGNVNDVAAEGKDPVAPPVYITTRADLARVLHQCRAEHDKDVAAIKKCYNSRKRNVAKEKMAKAKMEQEQK